ncbi:hypothetical protein MYP_1483 [Sporocytophaga myxococcoides]|uniref:Uncharacterized protein n=1 Tax=Sporocytophaga myxococcoides TaxID=153721 RepID=A0A098LBI8_9BACT|nr:hypothetical protein [Sporocytophaga myxococcoides]GAL84255.1 hypothetical protein MYP_1483 [Sporocytophaga myxococcoides]
MKKAIIRLVISDGYHELIKEGENFSVHSNNNVIMLMDDNKAGGRDYVFMGPVSNIFIELIEN